MKTGTEQYQAAWDKAVAVNDGTWPVGVRVWDDKGRPGWAVTPLDNGGDTRVLWDYEPGYFLFCELSTLSLTPPAPTQAEIDEAERELGRHCYLAMANHKDYRYGDRKRAFDALHALYRRRDEAQATPADHTPDAGKKIEHEADAGGHYYWLLKEHRGDIVNVVLKTKPRCGFDMRAFLPNNGGWRDAGCVGFGLSPRSAARITPAEARELTGDDRIKTGGA